MLRAQKLLSLCKLQSDSTSCTDTEACSQQYVFGVITRNSPEQIKSLITELNTELRKVYKHYYVLVSEISSGDVSTDKVHLTKSGASHFVGKVLQRLMNDCL